MGDPFIDAIRSESEAGEVRHTSRVGPVAFGTHARSPFVRAGGPSLCARRGTPRGDLRVWSGDESSRRMLCWGRVQASPCWGGGFYVADPRIWCFEENRDVLLL